ncbi:hypothetical protein [Candidatus Methylacidiphilum infernorum]|uniref:Uncharacterized protein n=2 Tax=Candidatus Methylacidiphilum infernorum TaxID=511746 RepID=B3DV76_METI4|nr:hypothetical protein [Candidatus Methylacidiphilum infernorum]ACD83229.1 Hypothetical protein Minf_1174 [Methylacidiphilum infernorum V4]
MRKDMDIFKLLASSNWPRTCAEEVLWEILWENTESELEKTLPPIPQNLLSVEACPNPSALESIFFEGKWLNLLVHPQSWPKELFETYYEDLLVLFSCLKSMGIPESDLQPVALCQFVRNCKKKRRVLENRKCSFYCLGICVLGTFQDKTMEKESLSPASIAYYLGLTKRQVMDRLKKANHYLRRELQKKHAFSELIREKDGF